MKDDYEDYALPPCSHLDLARISQTKKCIGAENLG